MNIDHLTETAAEVEQLVISCLSEFFEDVVLPRYGKTTKDGVKLTSVWWAEKLGMTDQAVRGRIERLRSRSEALSDRPDRPQERSLRAARQMLRDPETAKEVLKDVPLETVYAAVRAINEERFDANQAEIEAGERRERGQITYGEALAALESDPDSDLNKDRQQEKERENGALAWFLRGVSNLNTAVIVMQEEGIRDYDLDNTEASIDDLLVQIDAAELSLNQFRVAFLDAQTKRGVK